MTINIAALVEKLTIILFGFVKNSIVNKGKNYEAALLVKHPSG
jgi:hypothetical protein